MRHRLRSSAVTLIGIGVLASVASGCGTAKGTLTIYSGQHEQTVSLLTADFTKRTGIKVAVRSGGEAELANQILQEGSHSPADVFFAENPPALSALAEHELLAHVDAETLAAVPARDSSPGGDWVGVSARASVLVYNTAEITPAQLPTSLLDFESPKWKGKVGFSPEETDFQPLITAVATLKGGDAAAERWLRALRRYGKTYEDNESLVAAVNRGEVAVGLIDHYYWYRLRDELGAGKIHSKLAYFAAGDPGALVDVSGAAVLAQSKHRADGQKFLAYLVSKPAQTIIATSHSYEYPLAAGVTNRHLERSIASLHSPRLTVGQLGDGSRPLRLLQEVGLL